MKRNVFFIILLVVILSSAAGFGSEPELSAEKAVYGRIKALYVKWDSGLYGSRNYYRRRLHCLLLSLMGEQIETGYDYIFPLPGSLIKKSIVSDLSHGKWLHIHGRVDRKDLKSLTDRGIFYIRDLEKRKYLFSLSGKIVRFSLHEAGGGRSVHLYLDRIRIKPLSGIKRKNKEPQQGS